jgi:hypothetical protein
MTMRLRRSIFSKAIAAFFVAMIVLPFTAPFQTYDPQTPLAKHSAHDLNVQDKLAKDAGLAALAPTVLAVFGTATPLTPRRESRDVRRPLLRTVLRL